MILSDDCKKVIDTLLTYDEDMVNGFYSVALLEQKTEYKLHVWEILEQLDKQGMLYWGDTRRTGFRLLENARSYKNIKRLENRERWKERGIGFISGIVLSGIAWFLSALA